MKQKLLLPSLRTLGPLGEEAATHIEKQGLEVNRLRIDNTSLQASLDRSEQRVRDQAREIERLKRELAEAKSGPV